MKGLKKLLIVIFSITMVLIIGIFSYFKITAPEGCAILQHYYFGNGEPLELKSDYLPHSPVIIKALKRMHVEQVKTIRFHQKNDWRLSYALNPFDLKKTANGFSISQWIDFDTSGDVFTVINFYIFKIKIKDSWVHVFRTTPFRVHYTYTKK